MNTLDRYILREMFTVFLIAVFATTTLLYMDKFLLMAEMIVNCEFEGNTATYAGGAITVFTPFEVSGVANTQS